MKTAKFAGPVEKKKKPKKTHITKKEYRKTTAKSVDASLALAFNTPLGRLL